MKVITLSLCAISLLSCKQNNNKTQPSSLNSTTNNLNVKKETISTVTSSTLPTKRMKTVQEQNTTQKLLGIWIMKDSETGNANFVLKKSTIYYPESNASYPYKVFGDSLIVNYDDGYIQHMAFKFKGNDTLTLSSEDGPNIFYRVKR